MGRKLNFDIAKAMCIVLVVVGHFFPDGAPTWYVDLRFLIYTFHMPLFLFTSGYIYQLFKKKEPYRAFVCKKIKRLMVPYFVTSIIIITIKLLTQKNMYVENPVTCFSYVKMLYMPEAGYFLWFVWSLFLMFLLIPLLKTKTARMFAFVLSFIIHYLSFDLTPVFALTETKRMLVWFMFGVVCCDFRVGEVFIRRKWQACFLCVASVMAFITFSVINMHRYASLLSWLGIAVVMIIASLIAYLPKKSFVLNLFVALSSSSYVIYLFHTTFQGFAKSMLNRYMGAVDLSNFEFIVEMLIVVSTGLFFPVLLHKFLLARNTFLKMLFGLK